MKNLTLTSLSVALSTSLLIACGGGGGVNSSIDQTKPTNEVTDTEAQDVCQATADYAESKVTQADTCRATGFAAGIALVASGDDAMQEACNDAYDACLEADPEEETDCSDATADTADCDDTVTVGDVESCLQDTIDVGVESLDLIPSCDELTLEYFEELAENPPEEPEDPASCDVVYEGCPGFLE